MTSVFGLRRNRGVAALPLRFVSTSASCVDVYISKGTIEEPPKYVIHDTIYPSNDEKFLAIEPPQNPNDPGIQLFIDIDTSVRKTKEWQVEMIIGAEGTKREKFLWKEDIRPLTHSGRYSTSKHALSYSQEISPMNFKEALDALKPYTGENPLYRLFIEFRAIKATIPIEAVSEMTLVVPFASLATLNAFGAKCYRAGKYKYTGKNMFLISPGNQIPTPASPINGASQNATTSPTDEAASDTVTQVIKTIDTQVSTKTDSVYSTALSSSDDALNFDDMTYADMRNEIIRLRKLLRVAVSMGFDPENAQSLEPLEKYELARQGSGVIDRSRAGLD